MVVTSGGTNINIPISTLSRQQYVDIMSGKTINVPVTSTTLVPLPDRIIDHPLGDLSKIKNFALTLSVNHFSFDDLAEIEKKA